MAAKNRRTRSRVEDTELDVSLSRGGIESVPLKTRNLSLKGLLCDQSPSLKAGKRYCTLTFTLGRDVHFHVQAAIVRNDDRGLALDFIGMDETAFFHLRNLMRFHSGDPDAIDKELAVPAFKLPEDKADT